MRAFHIMIFADASAQPRRVDFHAESPDHAFQIARNENDGVHVELWEDGRRLASMTKSGSGIWKLHGPVDRPVSSNEPASL